MKIDGIDPLVLNRIREQTDRFEVQKTEYSITDNMVKRRHGSQERRETNVPDARYAQKLDQALQKLNDTAGERELPLRFMVEKDTRPWMVNIVDVSQNEVVRQIPTDQALEVLNRIQTLIGVSVDDRR